MPKDLVNSSRETWLKIWSNTKFKDMPLWDDQCELVHNLLTSLLLINIKGKIILETGSGTGRISLRLAKEGAKVVLLDISPAAINSSKNLFRNYELVGESIIADIFHLPFKSNKFNAVWSSGVLEHFTFDEMGYIIDESLKILKKEGALIVIVPNKNAFVYNFFRILDMKLGQWQWGYEEPLSSKDLYCFQSKPIIHRSAGFIYQLNFFSLPYLKYVWHKVLHCVYPILKFLDKNMPGYLVAGLWKK
jgi:ubiquinone/menaquinone biosynthesis C-methylase UbiE